ncbi:MAG: hypothetical protein AAF648_05100 [Pseudomonadota bacterium]
MTTRVRRSAHLQLIAWITMLCIAGSARADPPAELMHALNEHLAALPRAASSVEPLSDTGTRLLQERIERLVHSLGETSSCQELSARSKLKLTSLGSSCRLKDSAGLFVIVRPNPRRWLVFGAPHPLADRATARQALALFDALDGAVAIVASRHRRSQTVAPCSSTASPTGATRIEADASHSTSPYLVAGHGVARALTQHAFTAARDRWRFLEWHGMRDGSRARGCFVPAANQPVDVFISEGGREPLAQPGFAHRLQRALASRRSQSEVHGPGSDARCALNGGHNRLGRLINQRWFEVSASRAHYCALSLRPSQQTTGRFIHIEQRQASAQESIRSAAYWKSALRAAYDRAALSLARSASSR